MKLVNPESIHTNEETFIDTINAELDWEVIEKMLLEKHNFTMQDEIDYKKGDIVVYRDKIAYRFDFDIKVAFSVVFGRDGQCLEILISGAPELEPEHEIESQIDIPFASDSDFYFPDIAGNDDSPENTSNYSDTSVDGKNAEQVFDQDDSSVSGKKDISKMAADIADMISDINQEELPSQGKKLNRQDPM